jgi:hypothetical protein
MRVAARKTTYQPARREFGALAFSTQSAQLAHDPSRIERMGNSLTRLSRIGLKTGKNRKHQFPALVFRRAAGSWSGSLTGTSGLDKSV